jgi:hypothetical protein
MRMPSARALRAKSSFALSASIGPATCLSSIPKRASRLGCCIARTVNLYSSFPRRVAPVIRKEKVENGNIDASLSTVVLPASRRALHESSRDARSVGRAARANSSRVGSKLSPPLAIPTDDNRGILIEGPSGHAAAPSNWAFGQLANLSGAPGAYLRTLPAPLAADCLNYGLRVERDATDTGVLLTRRPGTSELELRAATGPRYGRIWNVDVVRALEDRFGDGVTGDFRVPGEFGRELSQVTTATQRYSPAIAICSFSSPMKKTG